MSWIAREIAARGGEVSFRDFMELALYHPRHGYYSAAAPRYGRGGDFLTAPTASRWYAIVLAGWLERLAARVGPVAFCDVAFFDVRMNVSVDDGQAHVDGVSKEDTRKGLRDHAVDARQLQRDTIRTSA